jgi:hypothetical protein
MSRPDGGHCVAVRGANRAAGASPAGGREGLGCRRYRLDDVGLDLIEDLQGIFISYMSRVDQATGNAEFLLGQNEWTGYDDLCGEEAPVRKRLRA